MRSAVFLILTFSAALCFAVVAPLLPRALQPAWWRRLWDNRRRGRAEDALKHMHHSAIRGEPVSQESLAAALGLSGGATSRLIVRMTSHRWIESTDAGLTLTPAGSSLALQVIRAHRLWERYLADEARMPFEKLHGEAERREHERSGETLDVLEASMGHPAVDPHGDPIPTAEGEVAELAACVLSDWPVDTPARIVHLEDEPPALFARIAAKGLRPGQCITVVEHGEARLVLSDGQRTISLPVEAAANIFVADVGALRETVPCRRLTSLRAGERATIDGLDQTLRGFTRRRLLDLGLTPGAAISAEMSGVFRDPMAYRVRGALIALRSDQASHVVIRPDDEAGN